MTEQFSPEQQEAIDAKLNEFGEKIISSVTSSMNTALSGLAKRLIVDEMPKAVSGQLTTLEEKLAQLIPKEDTYKNAIRSELENFLEEVAKKAEAETTESPNYQAESQAIADLKKQLSVQSTENEAIKQRLLAAEKLAQQEQQSRQQLAEEQRLARLEENVLTSLRGQVIPTTERQLLSLLRQDGILVEDNGELKIKGKDRYDLDTLLPIQDGLKGVIENMYPHFQSSRPGTGTGAAPATPSPREPHRGKFFASDNNISNEDLLAAFNDPNRRTELLKEADALLSSH